MPKHVRGKCRILCISSILHSKRGITPTRIDANWWHSNLICTTAKQSHICKISAEYVKACRRKLQKTEYFQYFKCQKGHNSYKDWRKLTKLELDQMFTRRKWHVKFQLNMLKHVGEKCGKLWLTDGDPDRDQDGRTDGRTDINMP